MLFISLMPLYKIKIIEKVSKIFKFLILLLQKMILKISIVVKEFQNFSNHQNLKKENVLQLKEVKASGLYVLNLKIL